MGKLVEVDLPIEVISRDAAIEMSFKPRPAYYARCKELKLLCRGNKFYDPKIRSIHPWPARRPRSVCRAVNLACILPEDISFEEYLKALGFSKEELTRIVSGGYPPLISYTRPNIEIIRKYNPSYDKIILLDPMAGGGSIPLESAILGLRTIALEYNPVAYLILKATIEYPAKYGRELYQKVRDEVVKLIEWARTNLGKYYREDDEGYIIVRGVKCSKGHVKPLALEIRLSSKITKRVYVKNPCNCKLPDPDKLWSQQHKRLMTSEEDDELLFTTHIYASRQIKGGFTDFKESDLELISKAYHKYLELREQLVLPKTRIPYVNTAFSKIISMGLNSFDLLLNPRQALAIGLISSYIKDRVSILYETEGDFGAAVSLYLAFGVSRMFDFNSILTTWNYRTKTIRDSLASYFSRRKFIIDTVYAEAVVPYRSLQWVFEPNGTEEGETGGGILPVLKELCEVLEGKGNKIQIYQGDALKLAQYLNEPIDIIHVDPPYYDVHTYSDMSELSWNILRTVLEPILSHLFNNNLLHEWSPDKTVVPRTNEIIARSKTEKYRFNTLLYRFLLEAYKVLKDNGILVLWFSHREWGAWESVIESLQRSGFSVVKVYPMASEHPSRLITKGGIRGFNRALIIVAKKRDQCKLLDISELDSEIEKIIEEAIQNIHRAKVLMTSKPTEDELVLFTAAIALTLITRVRNEDVAKAKRLIKKKVKEILNRKGLKNINKLF